MAQGDVTLFNQFKLDFGKKIHDLSADAFKLGLITSAVTPAASTADPRWGAGGSTNFSSNEVTPGGNYSAGGASMASQTWTGTSGTSTWDTNNVQVLQNASNPTNARWGIIYNNTAAGKQCIGFVDLGSTFDMTTGDLNVNWNASGIFTLS